MIDKGRNKSRRIIEKKRTARREKMYQAVEKIIMLIDLTQQATIS